MMTDDDLEERVQQLAADIAARLRKVCANLSDEDFSALVLDIAQMKIHFEVLEELPGGLRPLPGVTKAREQK